MLEAGTYKLTFYAQGGDASSSDIKAFVSVNRVKTIENIKLTTWCDWKKIEITVTIGSTSEVIIGITGNYNAGAWGTYDDFKFVKLS